MTRQRDQPLGVARTRRAGPLPRGGWPAGLPAPLTEFFGRERDRTEVARLVRESRLVVLTGAGGVGKTRLAIEVAAVVAPSFGDGVDLVDLTSVADPNLLTVAVARTVGLEERGRDDLADRLVSVLRPQRRLLVLDNCEHIRRACADLAANLLGSCRDLTVLATSRENLGLPGEVTWRVPSLAFPWPEHPPSLQDLEHFEAPALFLARARAAQADLVIGTGDVAAVTSICFQLDGIPLALELAAARVRVLSVGEMAERLGRRFDVLGHLGAGPARHQTLRASIEWSYELLSDAERTLLSQLAVFEGGWTLDTAEAVCGGTAGAQEVADLLAALVDKSLVQVEALGSRSRFRLLMVIRAFARELLAASGRRDQVRAKHAEHFVGLGEQSAPVLLGPDQAHWARRLDSERDNFRAARLWCAEDPVRAELGLRMVAGLWEYFHMRGLLVEGF